MSLGEELEYPEKYRTLPNPTVKDLLGTSEVRPLNAADSRLAQLPPGILGSELAEWAAQVRQQSAIGNGE
jgi:hypothetical protein